MKIFEKNYWGLYFDFLKTFKSWEYRGLPFSMCTHFYTMVRGMQGLEKKIVDPSYSKLWVDESVLQGRFEAFFTTCNRKNTGGKVVYYDQFLRIPNLFYKQLSPLSESLLLKPDITNMKRQPAGGIPLRGLNQYAEDVEGQVQKEIKRFKNIAAKYKNHPLFGKRHFLESMEKQIPKIMYFIEASERFLKTEKVSILILGETNSVDTRTLTLSARKRGIPTICIQHGAVISPFGYLPKVAEYQTVYGIYEQSLFEKRGVDKKFVPIIGHPRFDEIKTRDPHHLTVLNKKAKPHRNRKKILLIDHHTDKKKIHRILDLLLIKAPKLELIVKVQKGIKAFQRYEKQKQVHLVRRVHLYNILEHVDAVISYESTVVLESLLFGKRVFIWTLNQPGLTDYISRLPVTTYQTEERLVHELLTFIEQGNGKGENISEQISDHFYIPSHQKSTLLLKALIDSLRT